MTSTVKNFKFNLTTPHRYFVYMECRQGYLVEAKQAFGYMRFSVIKRSIRNGK